MDSHQRQTFVSIIKTLLLLATGALWAIVLRLIVSLPDPLAITVLIIIILVCMIALIVSPDDDDGKMPKPPAVPDL